MFAHWDGDLPAIAFTDFKTSTAGSTTASFTVDVGAARGDRIIIVGITQTRISGSLGTPSVTINGVSAALQVFRSNIALNSSCAAIFALAVPSGTTATVVVTSAFTITPGGLACAIWAATGLSTATASGTGSDTATNSAVSMGVPVQANGVVVACGAAASGGTGVTWSWSGITEQFDTAGVFASSGGSAISSTTTTRTVTGTPTNGIVSAVAASFR